MARSAVTDYGSSTTNIALERLTRPPGDSTRLGGGHRLDKMSIIKDQASSALDQYIKEVRNR